MSNDTNTPTITEFLLARIAEDEVRSDRMLDRLTWARRLRECAAKRAIIKQAEAASEDRVSVIQEFCVGMAETEAGYATDPGKLILENLAAVYSDHPDYNPDWAL